MSFSWLAVLGGFLPFARCDAFFPIVAADRELADELSVDPMLDILVWADDDPIVIPLASGFQHAFFGRGVNLAYAPG